MLYSAKKGLRQASICREHVIDKIKLHEIVLHKITDIKFIFEAKKAHNHKGKKDIHKVR